MFRFRSLQLSVSVIAIALFVSATATAQSAIGNCPVLPQDNIWNTPVDQFPVSASSSAWVTTIGTAKLLHPDFGSGLYNGGPIGMPYVTVAGTQTKVPATFSYASESDAGPYAVPLNAPIEGGSDRHALSIDTDHCILYELGTAYPQTASWIAGAGAIFNLLSNALRPLGWTSTDAAGLPIFPGLVRYDEVASGEIRHAIRFTVPQTQRAVVWPARHYASTLTGTQYPPMGARFRLRAGFDISRYSAGNQVILRALKKYGMMLADNGAAWFISGAPDSRWNNDDLHQLSLILGSDFEAVDVSSLMTDPNSGQAKQSTTVSVTVSPSVAAVPVNTTKQFSATVTNANSNVVDWSVDGAPGGNSTVGWISVNGLYTAPAVSGTFTVQAVSVLSPFAVGAATVSVPAPAPGATAAATFSKVDTTTRGTWKGVYGADGEAVASDSSNYPSYAQVTVGGTAYTWAASTSDVRAPQEYAGASRIASAWYALNAYTIDVNVTDGKTHAVAVYCLDWDNYGRSERIDVLDAGGGSVLDSRTVTGFGVGQYVVWSVAGHVTFRVTPLYGNAVVSGVFFGGIATGGATAAATFSKVDTTTRGTWKGVYGADGEAVASDSSNYPSYAQVTVGGTAYTWAASTSDVRAPQEYAGASRIASAWYALNAYTIDVNVTDGKTHAVAVYCLDWDNYGRSERIDVLDAGGGSVLDSRTVTGFGVGQYVVWNVAGHVTFWVTPLYGNAVVSGIFFR